MKYLTCLICGNRFAPGQDKMASRSLTCSARCADEYAAQYRSKWRTRKACAAKEQV